MTKSCCRCKEIKPLEEFTKNHNSKDGRNYYCKSCHSKHYFANKEYYAIRAREYRKKITEKSKKARIEYRRKTKENKAEYDKVYRQQKADKIREHKRNWEKRNKNNPLHKIKRNLRRRIHHVVRDGYKSASTMKLLGCTFEEFKIHLESLFTEGMTWDNYGLGIDKWHIDHKIPCSAFDLTKAEEQEKCFHYTNLQPLWEIENLKKSYIYNGINCRLTQDKNSIPKESKIGIDQLSNVSEILITY